MSTSSHSGLRAGFDAAFVFPFAAYSWKSRRGRECWIDLEQLQSALAGPISSVVERGGCAYVYAREDEFFHGVNEPAALRARLLEWHERLAAGLNRFAPTSPTETADLESMRKFVSEMWIVAEQAIDLERARWDASAL